MGTNPTGASQGTHRVYCGGGWNDFGKNLRSAYRAVMSQNNSTYNVGLRLVCNADDSVKGSDTTREAAFEHPGWSCFCPNRTSSCKSLVLSFYVVAYRPACRSALSECYDKNPSAYSPRSGLLLLWITFQSSFCLRQSHTL